MRSVYKNNEFILIQNIETYNAIMAWRPKADEFVNTELQRGFRQTFSEADRNANGLPKTNLAVGSRTEVINNYAIRLQPVQLTNGDGVTLIEKWVVNAKAAEPYLEYWKRSSANGGLSIDDGQGGTRDMVKNQTSDICHLDQSFYDAILALRQQASEE